MSWRADLTSGSASGTDCPRLPWVPHLGAQQIKAWGWGRVTRWAHCPLLGSGAPLSRSCLSPQHARLTSILPLVSSRMFPPLQAPGGSAPTQGFPEFLSKTDNAAELLFSLRTDSAVPWSGTRVLESHQARGDRFLSLGFPVWTMGAMRVQLTFSQHVPCAWT